MRFQAEQAKKLVYGLNNKAKLLLIIGALVATVLLFIIFIILWEKWLDTTQSLSAFISLLPIGLPFFLMFGFMPYWLISIWRCRLEVSIDGIVSYSGSYKVYTPWDNIIGVTVGPLSQASSVQLCTFLQFRQNALMAVRIFEGKQRHVAVIEKSWWLSRKAFSSRLDKLVLTNDLLTFPYDNWQTSEFGTYLQQYAPEAYRRSIGAKDKA